MRIEELQVGDWVNVKMRDRETNKEKVKTGRVVEISPYYKRVGVAFTPEDAKRWFGTGFPPEAIEPIPLSDELLERNGFEFSSVIKLKERRLEKDNSGISLYTTDEESKNTGGYHITLCVDDKDIRDLSITLDMRIFFVHQLQHLIPLSKIKKEIEI